MHNNNLKIALIGMPGCGKTTLGRKLADKLNLGFIDLDQYMNLRTNKTIEALFEAGEDSFRDIETSMLSEVATKNNFVVSTGGGIVKRFNNIEILKKEFLVIYINRALEDILITLQADTRPLLKNNVNNLYKLYEERNHLYEECCSFEVNNHGSNLNSIVDEIIAKIKENSKLIDE
jgi:shikimate kinase